MTVLIVCAGLYVVLVVALILAGRRLVARELAVLIPNLLLLFRDLIRDPLIPRGPKLILGAAVIWLISPIDLLPEFLPVIGPLDDAIVAGLALRFLVARAGVQVVRNHWRGEPATLDLILRAVRVR